MALECHKMSLSGCAFASVTITGQRLARTTTRGSSTRVKQADISCDRLKLMQTREAIFYVFNDHEAKIPTSCWRLFFQWLPSPLAWLILFSGLRIAWQARMAPLLFLDAKGPVTSLVVGLGKWPG